MPQLKVKGVPYNQPCLQVNFISPQEAVFAQKRGVPIIDVRPALDYDSSRIPGSVGIPFMRSITGRARQAWLLAFVKSQSLISNMANAHKTFCVGTSCHQCIRAHTQVLMQLYNPNPRVSCLQAIQCGRI